MRDGLRHILPALCAASTLTALATAQTAFPEAEPNSTKTEATAANCMRAGDFLTGLTTGAVTTAGSVLDTSVDMFRVRTCALPQGIYRHTLSITTSGTAGHTGTLRGLNQTGTVGVGGTIGTVDSTMQTSSTTTTPARSNIWFGFGKQEEVYYRIAGTASTIGGYTVTLSTVQVSPTAVAGVFTPGPITITTVGQGHSTDTDIYLFDANLNYIAQNDDHFGGTTLQSAMTRTLAAGTYFLAIGGYNTCTNQPAQADDDFVSGIVLDFPDIVASSSSTSTATAFNFSVSDGTTTTPVLASDTLPYELNWFQITVGAPTPPESYCFGDGTGTVCPCSPVPVPHGAAGNGCPNSLFAGGANLAASGLASVSADSLTLTGTAMPNSSALYFQGTAQNLVGLVFGDGLRCAVGQVIRLGTKANSGNTSFYPDLGAGDLTISVRGLVSSGGRMRTYQCWYRNADPAFCTAATFNLSNALKVIWIP